MITTDAELQEARVRRDALEAEVLALRASERDPDAYREALSGVMARMDDLDSQIRAFLSRHPRELLAERGAQLLRAPALPYAIVHARRLLGALAEALAARGEETQWSSSTGTSGGVVSERGGYLGFYVTPSDHEDRRLYVCVFWGLAHHYGGSPFAVQLSGRWFRPDDYAHHRARWNVLETRMLGWTGGPGVQLPLDVRLTPDAQTERWVRMLDELRGLVGQGRISLTDTGAGEVSLADGGELTLDPD